MVSSSDSRKLPIKIDLPEQVLQGLQKAKDFLTDTGKAVSTTTEATDQAFARVTTAAEQAKALVETSSTSSFLEDTLQKAERLNSTASGPIQHAMSSFVDQWIDSIQEWVHVHPAVSWAFQMMLWATHHPVPALGIILLGVFMLQRLLKVMSSLVEKALLFALQAPLKFAKFLLKASSNMGRFRGAIRPVDQTENVTLSAPTQSARHTQKEQLANILLRLEAIQQEENQLLQELATIIALDERRDIHSGLDQHLELRLPEQFKDVTPDLANGGK